MSYRETAQQRRIRELSTQLRYSQTRVNTNENANQKLRQMLDESRKQLEAANRNMRRQAERQRKEMQKESQKNRALVQRQNENIRALDRQLQEKERLQQQRLAGLQRQTEENIARLNQTFREENGRLRRELTSTRDEMRQGFTQIRQETNRQMREQREETDRQMQRLNNRLSEEIRQVDTRVEDLITSIREKEEGEKELAEYWSQQAMRLCNEMEANDRPQLFLPRRFEKLRQRVALAAGDFKEGRYSSAADGGREAFYEAMDLKEELAQAEAEWNYWRNVLGEREAQLLHSLQAVDGRVYVLELDGEQIRDEHGVDYWTNGQLTKVRNRAVQLRENTLSHLEDQPTDFLREQAEAVLNLQEELALVENAAHTNVAMSASRYDMASRIGAVLGDDFQMVESDGDFFGEENRDEYHAIFENPVTHDQTAVVITPIMGEDGIVTNHAEIIIGNADNNPLTRERINQAVRDKLNRRGFAGISFPCAQKYGDRTREEVARVGDIAAVTAGSESARANVRN